ncbi:MAG: hypothetical protein OXN89_19975 [Bryobacterales bacterium]|nr:hypothetical protein [Bryobacterales bacterium]
MRTVAPGNIEAGRTVRILPDCIASLTWGDVDIIERIGKQCEEESSFGKIALGGAGRMYRPEQPIEDSLRWVKRWLLAVSGFREPHDRRWVGVWLAKIGELFHLECLRRRTWQPALPLREQSEEFAAAQASLAASLEKPLEDALQQWQDLARRYELLERLQAGGGRTTAEMTRVAPQDKATSSSILHGEGLSVFL